MSSLVGSGQSQVRCTKHAIAKDTSRKASDMPAFLIATCAAEAAHHEPFNLVRPSCSEHASCILNLYTVKCACQAGSTCWE